MALKPLVPQYVGTGSLWFDTDTGIIYRATTADPDDPTLVAGSSTGDAEDIAFPPAGSIAATDVQAAIEELDTSVTGQFSTFTADLVIFTPAGTLEAVDVQAALEELDTDVQAL